MTCVNKDGCYLHDTRTPTSKIKKKKKEKKELQTGKMGKKMQQKSKSEPSPQNLLEEDDSEVSEVFFFQNQMETSCFK